MKQIYILIIFIINIYMKMSINVQNDNEYLNLLDSMLVSYLVMRLGMMIIPSFYLSLDFIGVLSSFLIFIVRTFTDISIFKVTSCIFQITRSHILLIMSVYYKAFQFLLVFHFSNNPNKSFHLKM